MKPRKIILTIEILTDIKLKEFNKPSIQEMFNNNFVNKDENITVHQVCGQVVKPEK